MKRIGIYAGSFDPPTLGHQWMIQRGAELFDELVVLLAINPDKTPLLSQEERCSALQQMLAHVPGQVWVEILPARQTTVSYARHIGATHLLRGVRCAADLDYERSLLRMNATMEPGIQTVLLMPPPELEHITSSMVKGFLGLQDWERWVSACVPPAVLSLIRSKLSTHAGS